MGRTRAGLEVWIAKQNLDLPEMLVAAARSLADEVDRDPDASPLWGRYLDCLRQLQEPEQQAKAWNDELRRVFEVMALGRADEEWRNRQHVLAVERGDLLAWGWQKVVPISCVRGHHDWKPPGLLGRRAVPALRHGAGGAVSEPAPIRRPNRTITSSGIARSRSRVGGSRDEDATTRSRRPATCAHIAG